MHRPDCMRFRIALLFCNWQPTGFLDFDPARPQAMQPCACLAGLVLCQNSRKPLRTSLEPLQIRRLRRHATLQNQTTRRTLYAAPGYATSATALPAHAGHENLEPAASVPASSGIVRE